jgi:hypothetical protein
MSAEAMFASPPKKRTYAVLMSALHLKADIGQTSDEHSDAWQDNPDLGELARLRIHLN